MDKTFKFTNKEVSGILKEILAAMEVKAYNRFRIRAYQNALAAIDNLTSSIYDMWENRRLNEIPGVGEGLERHLNELFTTGEVQEYKSIKEGLPDGMFALLGLRGIGAKKAFKLANNFKLVKRETTIEKLKECAKAGKIRIMDGFGEKSEKDILEAISDQKKHKNAKPRLLLIQAEEVSNRITTYLNKMKNSNKLEITALGSLRRRAPTVGDIDIAVATNAPDLVLTHFLEFPEIEEALVKGEEKVSVVLKNDIQVDLRVSTPKAYGSMLQYFTGSKQHNVILRTYAMEKGLSLSEYGIKENGKILRFSDEKRFYHKMGLPYIPPEIRHGLNEISLAAEGKLPKLIELQDIKGDLHTHTVVSDGINTLSEMTEAATTFGYAYLGISDHAPSVQTRNEAEVLSIVRNQKALIEQINNSQDKVRVLLGYEVNILNDAAMSLPDRILKELDYAIASIHTSFDQPRELVTKRLINAIKNPYINIIGHPSGRLINQREGCDINWKEVFDAALDYDKVIEINAQPNRLDLADDLVREAVRRDIKLIINTDAHATVDLNLMRFGIDVARRGFCEKKNIINTLSLQGLLKILKR